MMTKLARLPRRALGLLWRPYGWGLLVLPVVLGVAGGATYALTKTPSYTARAHVIVVSAAPGAEGSAAVDFAQAYGRIATQQVIVARAAAALAESPGALTGAVRASTSPDAPVIEITGTGGSAATAAARANALSEALVAYGGARRDDTRVRLSSFAPASPPVSPSSPNLPLDVAVGGAAGLLIGGLLILGELDGPNRSARRHRRRGAPPGPEVGPVVPLVQVVDPAQPDSHGQRESREQRREA
jgi:capsular polysaccharide biosynthesis protein